MLPSGVLPHTSEARDSWTSSPAERQKEGRRGCRRVEEEGEEEGKGEEGQGVGAVEGVGRGGREGRKRWKVEWVDGAGRRETKGEGLGRKGRVSGVEASGVREK